MYYIIYKITNKINGKIYIGSHKTKNLYDQYMGSGKYLKYSLRKHGIENFIKEILFVYDNPYDMYNKESELVNEEFLSEENTYNIKLGGCGGFDHLNNDYYNNPAHSTEHSKNMTKRRLEIYSKEERSDWSRKGGMVVYEQGIGIHALNKKGSFSGRVHTDETKKKISEKNSINQKGKNNSQFGTKWAWVVRKNETAKKIPLKDLNFYLENGYKKGIKYKD